MFLFVEPQVSFSIVNLKHCVKSARIRSVFRQYFPRIRTEYGETRSISPYLLQMRKNTDQENSEYGHYSRSEAYILDRNF